MSKSSWASTNSSKASLPLPPRQCGDHVGGFGDPSFGAMARGCGHFATLPQPFESGAALETLPQPFESEDALKTFHGGSSADSASELSRQLPEFCRVSHNAFGGGWFGGGGTRNVGCFGRTPQRPPRPWCACNCCCCCCCQAEDLSSPFMQPFLPLLPLPSAPKPLPPCLFMAKPPLLLLAADGTAPQFTCPSAPQFTHRQEAISCVYTSLASCRSLSGHSSSSSWPFRRHLLHHAFFLLHS
mmetsp:Transcript_63487/g.176586  ORF Transcript_63487/g.176586 Transcript_63487/m.176586 type:complete len:242 (-) Transcript_63487:1539-2264(-)